MLSRKFTLAATVCAALLFVTHALSQTPSAGTGTPSRSSDQNSQVKGSSTGGVVPPATPSTSAQPSASGSDAAPTSTVTQNPVPSNSVNSPQTAVSTGAANTSTGGTRVHGTISDPDGYPIPGATVTFTPVKGAARTAKTGTDGTYQVVITPGGYNVVVKMQGFASYSTTNLRIPAVAATTMDAKLSIGEQTQIVNVDANSVQVSVDPDSNASSTILTGADLDALSDDPDELASELQALAGPSAGPNGGQIYVDGFTGGQLPPKSSIREIRINQNPFSAQYDKVGYGRVEIFTKPGTDQFHGSISAVGNAKQFNAGVPPGFDPTVGIPDYHRWEIYGSISGPITKWASFNLGGSHRTIQDAAFTNATVLATAGAPTTPCLPTTGFTGCVSTQYRANTFQPQSRTEVSPRIDLAIGKNNTLSTRFEILSNDSLNGGVGAFAFANTGTYASSSSFELQMSDTQTYGPRVINETRFEWERERATTTANANTPYYNVQGAFDYGGANAQGSSVHQDHLEWQNYTSIQLSKNFIRLGGRVRSNSEAENTLSGTNGALTYAGLGTVGSATAGTLASGIPSQYQLTIVNNHDITARVTDVGLYAETDWKPTPKFTLSYGLRYESQTILAEHHDFAPRVSFAYGLGKGNAPKTVLRGGFGIFYDRFAMASVLESTVQNGRNTTVYQLQNPNCTTPASCQALALSSTSTAQAIVTLPMAPTGSGAHLQAPYMVQAAIGADQQLGRIASLSVNYLHIEGAHALGLENILCATSPVTGKCTTAGVGANDQFLSEGHFHEDQLMLNPHISIGKSVSLFSYYSLSFASGNSSGAETYLSQPGNINADLGRTSFDIRSRYFVGGSVILPKYIQLSPFVIGQSGNPYNITEGQDINGDGVYNDRPLLVPVGTPNSVSIANCGAFLSHNAANAAQFSTLVPSYDCKGPNLFTMNLRVSKTFGFGPMKNANQGDSGKHSRGDSGMPGGGPGGSGGGAHSHTGGSSGGPGGMFGGSSTGRKYNLSVGVQALDLFNTQDLAKPVGTITSVDFGKSTQLAGSPFTGANALFRLQLNAVFTF